MEQRTLRRSISFLALSLAVFVAFSGCKKEVSKENGAFSGTATGELVDSLGYCKNITVHGSYKVDTALNGDNYVIVNVNFTSAGKYKIYSDTANGMWFLDSGFVVSSGKTTVKLKGKGTPILPKQSDFAVFFGNNLCTFSITPTDTSRGTSGGGGGNTDYFPTSAGSNWLYVYNPKLGSVDTFTVTVAANKVQVPGDTLMYAQFGTRMQDTFYFAKSGLGEYWALSTVDFDYTLVFDSIPDHFVSYPFLKPNGNVGDTWESAEWGKVRVDGTGGTKERGYAKAVFTIISKNTTPYTIGGKTYDNVINMKRDIMFKPDGGTYRVLLSGNSYYAKGYGMIDQQIGATPSTQSVSVSRTPDIK